MDMSLNKHREIVEVGEGWRTAVHGIAVWHDLSTEQQQFV